MAEPALARQLWWALEPYHAVVYFAPDAKATYERIGSRGFGWGIFASRAAPLGPVPAAVVTATFFNFHPAMVARAIPDAWQLASPTQIIARGSSTPIGRCSTCWAKHACNRQISRGRDVGPPRSRSGAATGAPPVCRL